jgi:PAS domain S-box-containing protein
MVENRKRTGQEESGDETMARALAALADADVKRSLRELWERERVYREMVENANSIILRVDIQGRILFFNEFAQRFFGYSSEEILGKNVLGTIIPETDSAGRDLKALIADIAATPERFRLNENENIRRDGSRVWVSWANKPFYDASGTLVEMLCIGQDVTEHRMLEQALREKSEELERYFDLSLDLLCIATTSGMFVKVNPQWQKVLGYTQQELVGRNFLELVHPDDVAATLAAMTTLDENTDVENFQNRYLCRDCGYRWIEWRSRAPGNGLIYAVARDITERKEAEEVLRRSEETFRNIVHASPMGIHMYRLEDDQRLIFVGANPTADRQLGMDNAAFVGKTLEEAFPPLAETEIALRYRRAALYGERWQTEQVVYSDGKVAGAFEVYVFQMSAGKIAVLFNEITRRKQVEESLRESEERFKALHNASFGGIFLHDQGVIFECNQGLTEMTGYSADELVGMDGMLLVAPASSPVVLEKIRSGNQKPYEAVGLRKNGEEYPVRIEARIIPFKGRQVRSVEFRDQSEAKRNEAEREKLQGQLVQAQKMESVGRLAGGIAHDFNNMLSVILGHVELAQCRVEAGHPLAVTLEEIGKAARRSTDLTRQLLAFARKQTVVPQVLNLNETVEGVLTMLRRLIGEDIELRWLPGEECGLVNIDPTQVDQILANLCINARDAISDTGMITIETGIAVLDQAYCAAHIGFIPGEFALLAVSDDGCGMDDNIKAHLFEPFFTTKATGKGTGLGLAMVYGIVKQNNGFINVYSEPGQGTTFRIYLPRHSAKEMVAAQSAPSPTGGGGHETILLVEDEPMILSITTTMLHEFGYTVLAAASPGEAIALAREHAGEIDLLITDVVMPEMNGRDLAKTLLTLYPNLKRLFMSGYTANVIAHHGVLDAGVHFLQKPFSMDDLGAKIRAALAGD